MKEIPIIDFGEFLNEPDEHRKKIASKNLINAFKTYGFVYLKNFNISQDLISQLFAYNKQFFDKPIEYKNSVKKSFETFCGYDAFLDEKLSESSKGDLKESFMFNENGTPWPHDWKDFKEFSLLFHSKCKQLAFKILESIANGLDLDRNVFKSKYTNSECTVMRLLHYPPIPEQIAEKQVRCGEHSDYGSVSILFQDSVGGLEIKTRDDEWIPAPFIENTVLINVGQAMETWTNGCLTATPHRVVNPVDERMFKSRYSNAFFCDPDLDTQIICIDEKFLKENQSISNDKNESVLTYRQFFSPFFSP